ncbi:MAG: DUF1501 domain-containing protein, partial [Planctomycetaceae bacterium]|nr:DUF1501 domain-containing protein [Planctomycetaceae bacterium]
MTNVHSRRSRRGDADARRNAYLPRRRALQLGLPGAFAGLTGSSLLNAAQTASPKLRAAGPGTARRCILIWLDGGPSHLETFDVKPDAPQEVRGPLEDIATSVPGIRVSECLPEFSRRMEHFAVIRSMTSPLGEHNLGTHYLQTGYPPTAALEYPAFHCVATSLRENASALPGNIAIPEFRVAGARFTGHGFLPKQFAPFSSGGDPAAADFQVRELSLRSGLTTDRLEQRREFARAFRTIQQSQENAAQAQAVSGQPGAPDSSPMLAAP